MSRKSKNRAFSNATFREVKKEMAKPRIVESVRREALGDPGPREFREREALIVELTRGNMAQPIANRTATNHE